MRGILIIAALLATGLAGCTDPDAVPGEVAGTPSGATRGPGEYWFVWITGDERRDPPPGSVCNVAWSHGVDEAMKAIEYYAGPDTWNHVEAKPTTVIASTVWDASDCPLSYQVTSDDRIEIPSKALGTITIQMSNYGGVRVGDTQLQPGQQITLEGSREVDDDHDGPVTYTAEILVRVLGPWPHDRLVGVP